MSVIEFIGLFVLGLIVGSISSARGGFRSWLLAMGLLIVVVFLARFLVLALAGV